MTQSVDPGSRFPKTLKLRWIPCQARDDTNAINGFSLLWHSLQVRDDRLYLIFLQHSLSPRWRLWDFLSIHRTLELSVFFRSQIKAAVSATLLSSVKSIKVVFVCQLLISIYRYQLSIYGDFMGILLNLRSFWHLNSVLTFY